MVGRCGAIDVQIECKENGKYATKEQRAYLSTMKALGARAGIARSLEEARWIIEGMSSL